MIKLILFYFFIGVNLLFAQSGWFWQNPVPTGNDLNCLTFVNSNTGYLTGNLGTVAKTTDRGNTWRNLYTKTIVNLNSNFFTDENT